MNVLRNRKVQIASQAVVITALVGGTAAFVGLNKSVDVTVDGETNQIRTFGSSVDDVLASQGVDLEKGDHVTPAANTQVKNGMKITVNTVKDVQVSVDGVAQKGTTTASTVGQALADLGINAGNAEVNRSLKDKLTDGSTDISVVTAKGVTVVADGKAQKITDTSATVADVLKKAEVNLGANDFTDAPLAGPVVDGQVVNVMRVKTEDTKVTETIAKKVETKKSKSLPKGERKVEKKGTDGKREVSYRVRTINGNEVEKQKLGEKILSKPVTEVVVIGTKPKETSSGSTGSGSSSSGGDAGSSSGGSSGGSDSSSGGSSSGGKMSTAEIKKMLGGPGSKWYQVVKCESNFNPRAVNSVNRAHFGLFQFKLATWRSVGGSGNPIDASPQEQFKRAKILQKKAGWGQWSCA